MSGEEFIRLSETTLKFFYQKALEQVEREDPTLAAMSDLRSLQEVEILDSVPEWFPDSTEQ